MTYPAACTDADRIPTHCGTFIEPNPTPPAPLPAPDPEPAAETVPDPGPAFGGPLFDDLLAGSLVH